MTNSQNRNSNSASSKTAQGNSNAASEFFDLHTRGIGYLNRARWVDTRGRGGRRGDPFLACSVNALHGDSAEPNTTLFDCRVSGSDAQDIVQTLMPMVDANKKVFVGFVIGDIYAHVYERNVKKPDASGKYVETGEKETASLIKGRLLQITYVKVDGVLVYTKDKDGVVQTTLKLANPPAADNGDDQNSFEDDDQQSRSGTNG